eukprot:TRINITY_DN62659_c0_g1_i1.p1 TRINITY_DN62659_c0_g1~~TRINITY_DN62659_c0_g1_i1.p1  ORF type:complete len:708 (-),score=135.80 TRINITY_DN62659_c0_g1_i1:101-2224(-)
MESTTPCSPSSASPKSGTFAAHDSKQTVPTPPLTPAPKRGKEKRRPAPLLSLPTNSAPQVSDGAAKPPLPGPDASAVVSAAGTEPAAARQQPVQPRIDAAACAAAVASPRPGQSKALASEGASTTASSGADLLEVEKLDELECLGKLGSGASGFVEKQRHRRTGRELALKVIQANDVTEPQRKAMLLELRTFAKCRCPHIVDFYGAFFEEGSIHIALEFMDAGALSGLLAQTVVVPERFLAIMSWQVLDGLEYLHSEMHVIHRDIKPSNLVLSRAGVIKITDFGVSGELEDDLQQKDKVTFVGTMYYMSPERVRGERYKYDSDIWSLGLTLYECASGRYPYAERGCMRQLSFWELMKKIVDHDAPQLPSNEAYGLELINFVSQMLQKEPRNRHSAAMMKTHAWLVGSWPPTAPARLALADWISSACSSSEANGAVGEIGASKASSIAYSSGVSHASSPPSTAGSLNAALMGGIGGCLGNPPGDARYGSSGDARGLRPVSLDMPPLIGSGGAGGGGLASVSAPGSAGSTTAAAPHPFSLSRGGRMSGGWPTAKSSVSAASAPSSLNSSPLASPAAFPADVSGALAADAGVDSSTRGAGTEDSNKRFTGVALGSGDSAGSMMGKSVRGNGGYNLFRPRPPVAPTSQSTSQAASALTTVVSPAAMSAGETAELSGPQAAGVTASDIVVADEGGSIVTDAAPALAATEPLA